MHVKYACVFCKKTVAKNHNAICGDKCNQWVHITCNKITKYCYKNFQRTSPHGNAGCELEGDTLLKYDWHTAK